MENLLKTEIYLQSINKFRQFSSQCIYCIVFKYLCIIGKDDNKLKYSFRYCDVPVMCIHYVLCEFGKVLQNKSLFICRNGTQILLLTQVQIFGLKFMLRICLRRNYELYFLNLGKITIKLLYK